MAFTTPLTINGRSYPAAYVRVRQTSTFKQETLVEMEAWESQAERNTGLPPLNWNESSRRFSTQLELANNNPLDYAYQLLEDSNEWPDAQFNVN
jgi:outer membrane protease